MLDSQSDERHRARMKHILQRFLFGPFFYVKDRWFLSLFLISLIGVLTVLTQVGGVVLWLSLPVLAKIPLPTTPIPRRITQCLVFSLLYVLCIILVLPLLAPLNGRVPLPWFATSAIPLKPANLGYCLLARNYVRPPVRQLLERTAQAVSQQAPGTVLHYLDANFPFLNRFPLLPHLSHHDGGGTWISHFSTRIHSPSIPCHRLHHPLAIGHMSNPQRRSLNHVVASQVGFGGILTGSNPYLPMLRLIVNEHA